MQARRGVLGAALVAAMLAATATSALAAGGGYSPLNRPGPRLHVGNGALRRALACKGNLRRKGPGPILLIPGTGLTPGQNFSWNYGRAFAQLGWPYCALSLPAHATGNASVAGQYVVYGVRTMARRSRRRVDVLGYSEGGMLARWALRFWPDTRSRVGQVVGLDPSNHGSLDAGTACELRCVPAYWQQTTGSQFLAALNSGAETFSGTGYTVIFSRTAPLVPPNLGPAATSSLHTGSGRIANVSVQRVCPNDVADHVAIGSYDPVAYALVLDALTHSGTASAARISSTVCSQPFLPTVVASRVAKDVGSLVSAISKASRNSPRVAAEPSLPCYVFAACPARSR